MDEKEFGVLYKMVLNVNGYACLAAQSCPTLCETKDGSLPGSSVHADSPGKNTRVGCHCPPPGDLPNPGIELGSPALQADSLPAELPGKPNELLSNSY